MSAVPNLRPIDMLLSRLEGMKPAGRGYRGPCPQCGGKSAKLSVTEADNGAVLLTCFGGCTAAEVLVAVGLTLSDLFPERLRPMTDAERRDAWDRARITGWQAALEMLCKEAAIVHLAQRQLAQGQVLSADDDARLKLAEERIANARNTLCPPPARFRPEVVNG